MARYRIMRWRDIPAQVTATDQAGSTVTRQMPPTFQQEIDRVAMREGIIASDAYLEAWAWSAEAEREGDADSVADAVVAELVEAWRGGRQT
jgi:hypothetical protein